MILSFSRLGRHGRLGNQLFQITSTMGLAERYGAKAVFPDWKYEPYFETAIPHGAMQPDRVTEKHFHHHDWGLKGSCDILGYLQSEKYFGSFRLKLKGDFIEAQKAKMPIFDRETICIHIRRGDFVTNDQYYHVPVTYYLRALIEHFPNWKESNLLFLSDDIEYCRVHFECLPNAHFSTGLSDIEDLALGSACDHFIISNSTFGWWAAWLGEKEGTKVVRPSQQFAGHLAQQNSIEDYAPDRWISYDPRDCRLDLKDVTFTIPVLFDHPSRKDNLDLVLCMLQRDLDSHFIICEQGGDKFSYTSQWARYVQTDAKLFHRTRMLNDMAALAHTPFLANWDCDVIIPPVQIWMAVEELRAGAAMVYPYDGRFARMPRADWFPRIQKSLDIGVVGSTDFKGRQHGHNSVGGAVLWNADSFVDGGMENEHFISFGPEDCERHDRFKTLGYDIRHIDGSLFHMNHYVGENSSPRNPAFDANVAEQEKVHGMTQEELRAYVDTWPWRHPYTSLYYQRIREGSIRSAASVMASLPFRVESLIDIGCGVGGWSNGIRDYIGVDYGVRKKDLLLPAERFVECDLNKDFPPLDRKFDLCLCLEVAEHLLPSRAEELVTFLCSLSDRVLFSAAIPHQGGVGHINEQWQSYWASLFDGNGFGAAWHQPDIRECEEVELWYRQNMVLYARGGKGLVSDFVLPAYYLEIVRGLKARLDE